MSILYTSAMQRLLLIVGVTMGVVLGVLLVLLWRSEHLAQPVIGGEVVVLQQDGQLVQGEHLVGLAEGSGDGEMVAIPLARPGGEAVVTGSLEVAFPAPAEGLVQVIPSSIEGSDVITVTWVTENKLRITLLEALSEGYPTVLIRLPKDFVTPSFFVGSVAYLHSLPITQWLMGCVIFLVVVFSFAYLRTRPVTFTGKGEEIPQPPGDLRPIELALLHHGVVRPSDMAALFYSLAERGYLEIIDHGDETEEVLFLRSRGDDGLTTYEKNFLLMLFTQGMKPIRLSQVLASLNQELFSAVAGQLYVEVYDSFAARGFFRDTPRAIHLRYKTTGIVLQSVALVLALVVLFGVIQTFPALLVIAGTLYVAGALTFRIGYRVIPLSRLGWQLVRKATAFVRYLRSPEPFVWGVGPDSDTFYRYIPFALVAEEVPAWYARFRNYKRWEIPGWYTDIDDLVVTPEKFVSQVGVVATVLAEAVSEVKDPNVD